MAHYAKVLNGKVTQVIVAEEDFFDTFIDDTPGKWIQTSYNTRHGEHKLDGTPLRKNFAGVGFNYDKDADAFYPPQPYPSWTLDKTIWDWEAPVPHPTEGGRHEWNEETQSWDAVE